MTKLVRPFINVSSARWIWPRVRSTLLVEVVQDQDARFSSSARAMAMRCFWPPDSVVPRSPTGVS